MAAMLGLGTIYVSTLGPGDRHDRSLEPLGNWMSAMCKNGTIRYLTEHAWDKNHFIFPCNWV